MAHIGVVDDDRAFLAFLTDVLEDAGHAVIPAQHGQEALTRFLQHPPDVIFLDLSMPVMDGAAFLDARQRYPGLARIPVVVISAAREIGSRAHHLHVPEFMIKPIDLDMLLDTVMRYTAA